MEYRTLPNPIRACIDFRVRSWTTPQDDNSATKQLANTGLQFSVLSYMIKIFQKINK